MANASDYRFDVFHVNSLSAFVILYPEFLVLARNLAIVIPIRVECIMIRQIVIQNIAIANNLSVEFGQGLNIVTGETGAGKSILVDALALLRGGRIDIGLIRTGSDSAQVSGVFAPSNSSPVWDMLAKHGISVHSEQHDEVIVRRILNRGGKHRAFINDVPVSARILQEIAEELIDISSQFENQKLLDVASHTKFLDEFCSATQLAQKVATLFDTAHGQMQKIRQAEVSREKKLREKDLFEFEFQEITKANINAEEFLEIEHLLQTARKSGAVTSLCAETLGWLVENDASCFSLLQYSRKNLEKLDKIVGRNQGNSLPSVLTEAFASIDAAVDEVRVAMRAFLVDEEKLAWANERIEIYNKLLRKFGPTVNDIVAHRDRCEEFLGSVSSMEDEIDSLTTEAVSAVRRLLHSVVELSRERAKGPGALSQSVQKELADLGMSKARFVCVFQPCLARQEGVLPERVRAQLTADEVSAFLNATRSGAEEARFLLSANAGIDPQSIEKVASGGELSRVMLAIKTILFANDSVSLFVFDEIDTGISGSIAAKVGKKLSKFCEQRQAICITHLPQVACFARSHFVARKSSQGGKTVASLTMLKREERAQELATMLSGERMTQESLAQARALLKEAQAQ